MQAHVMGGTVIADPREDGLQPDSEATVGVHARKSIVLGETGLHERHSYNPRLTLSGSIRLIARGVGMRGRCRLGLG